MSRMMENLHRKYRPGKEEMEKMRGKE